MKVLFWLLIALIFYCYFGYPVLLSWLARLRTRHVNKAAIQPAVSIILSVCNEEDVIERKLENMLSANYPIEKIEILIGSDGSSDRTNEILKNIDDSRIKYFIFPDRRGKMVTLNELVKKANNEVLIFTDARQEFDSNAIQELVNNFNDNKIGCVSGELIFRSQEGGTAKGISLYWEYEKYIRQRESQLHSMLGATGAIYAVRKELYTPIPQEVVLDDMFVPLQIIKKGFRAIFDPAARAFDNVASNPREEHRRKTRTLYGNYQMFGKFASLFIPGKSPIAIQLFSHKFLRVIIPFFLMLIFTINIYLAVNPAYYYILCLQFTFYTMAMLGAMLRNTKQGLTKIISKMCYVPYVFCLLNFSALMGFIKFLGQDQAVTWQKARET